MQDGGSSGFDPAAARASSAETLIEPFRTVDHFLDPADAEALRSHLDAHFAEPYRHRAETHQVWNYWYVPDLYTYFRTTPEKVLPRSLVGRFHARLGRWALETLGLGFVTWPYLSLYVDGCCQHLHNDSTNGRFGFVYSLTRDQRDSRGGETMVLREGDLFRSHLTRNGAGPSMHELIAPRFNRLTIFDDRMPHGVRRIEGSMDPAEGRIVMHGHISEAKAQVRGPLPAEAVAAAVEAAAGPPLADAAPDVHGPLTLRLAIDADGRVEEVRTLVDRVTRADGGETGALVDSILDRIGALRFAAQPEASIAWVPIMAGGPLPWMTKAPPAPIAAKPRLKAFEQPLHPIPTPRPKPPASEAKPAAPLPPGAAIRARLNATPGLVRIPKDRLEAFVVPDFLTPEACADLRDSAAGAPARAAFEARLDALLGAEGQGEPSEMQRVGADGVPAACDFLDPDDPATRDALARAGQRSWSVLAFLDVADEGGQIDFPNAALKVTPAAGYLLVWNNLDRNGAPNGFALHETLPVAGAAHHRLIRRYREPPAEAVR